MKDFFSSFLDLKITGKLECSSTTEKAYSKSSSKAFFPSLSHSRSHSRIERAIEYLCCFFFFIYLARNVSMPSICQIQKTFVFLAILLPRSPSLLLSLARCLRISVFTFYLMPQQNLNTVVVFHCGV